MGSKTERLDISMRILGARQMEREGERGAKAVKKPGEAARYTEKHTTKLGKANSFLTRTYGALGKAAKYGIGILGVTGVFALQSAIHNTEELSKTTTGLNRNLDLSVKTSSNLAAVTYARGIANTTLTMSMTKLGKTFVDANRKGGTARTALNQLGITMGETEKGAHNFNYALNLVAEQLGKTEGGPRRQAAALAILGKGYKDVLPLFSSGKTGLMEQEHWAEKYGVTLDGKTNSALMDMVNAQRESKVAMLGLQVTLTRALMPAIEAGEGELQKFIATLNDPKMSADQKITAIEKQFDRLEDKVFAVLDRMAPGIAEHAGRLGIKVGIGLWHGFWNSDAVGKLAIGGWLFKSMGGLGLIRTTGGKAGGTAGSGFATGFIAGATGLLIGWELGKMLDHKTHGEFRWVAKGAAETFVNTLIDSVSQGLDEANFLSWAGVDAPNFGHVHLRDPQEEVAHGAHISHPPPKAGVIPPGSEGPGITSPPPGKGGKGKAGRSQPRRNIADLFGDQHIHVEIDGKEVAVATARHAARAAARR